MFSFLPLSAGALLTLLFYSKQKDWRSAILAAAVSLGVFIALSTELLSVFHLINFIALVFVWLLINGSLIAIAIKRRAFYQVPISAKLKLWLKLEAFEKLLFWGNLIIVFAVGSIALAAPPNNWDSMSYVMPRVMHWMQNHSINHYPAHYTSQLYNSPWTQFSLMHLQILSGGDWLANLPQWLSMIGCLLGVSLIAKHIGANVRGEFFSALICATIPIGILQASNSKDTYAVAFWLVCLVYYSLLLLKNQPTWNLIFAVSASFGLAVLTKGTAYIYALPFITLLSLSLLIRLREKALIYLIPASIIFLGINLGHYCRNFFIFGSPISTYPYNLSNEIYTVPAFISNVIKNISLHVLPPFFGTETLDHFVTVIHQFLGISPVDPRLNIFLGGYPPAEFTTQNVQLFEDTAGNSFHFWLTLLAITLFLKDKDLRKNKLLFAYGLATILSFLTFCLLIKWQIWHSRLHLPGFVLICPFIGIVLAQTLHRKIAQYILIVLLVTASPYLLLNETRPIAATKNVFNTDRITQYFAARSNLQADYANIVNLANQNRCREIGLIQRPDAWEYPLWILLSQKNHSPLRIEDVNVTNPSNVIAQSSYYQNFQPCMLVTLGVPSPQQVHVHNQLYEANKWQSTNPQESMRVFFKRQTT